MIAEYDFLTAIRDGGPFSERDVMEKIYERIKLLHIKRLNN